MHGIAGRRFRELTALLPPRNTARTIVALVAFGGPAAAAEVDASATLVSDYRFRGVSLSGADPAAEASLTATTTAGWFAGVEGVATARSRDLRRPTGRTAEIDTSAGWSRSLGLLTPSAGVIGYLYAGAGNPSAVELFGSVAGALGPATVTLGANYAPDQAGAAGSNLYTFVRAAVGVPATPVTVTASVGREAGRFALGRTKLDYGAGVEIRVSKLTLSARYVGNDLPRSVVAFTRHGTGDTIVGGVSFAF